jgi:hypothetical protein
VKLSASLFHDDDGFIPVRDGLGRAQLPYLDMHVIVQLKPKTVLCGRRVIDGFCVIGTVIDERKVYLPLYKTAVPFSAIDRWEELE